MYILELWKLGLYSDPTHMGVAFIEFPLEGEKYHRLENLPKSQKCDSGSYTSTELDEKNHSDPFTPLESNGKGFVQVYFFHPGRVLFPFVPHSLSLSR